MAKKKDNDLMGDLITPTAAAELRGVSRAAISDLIKRGRLQTYTVGGRTFVSRDEVKSFEAIKVGRPKGKSRKGE